MTVLLANLTPVSIYINPFPITELLEKSIYYPSSHFDGSVVKAYAYDHPSFVYCDYGVTEADFVAEIQTFWGYDVLAHRPVQEDELVPNGWQPQMPQHLLASYGKYPDYVKPPFAHWAVYERKPDYSDMHGPVRFSLLFVGGEGVATYQALYWSNRTTARAVAIVRPGTGFGCNWTNFLDGTKALGYVVTHNPHGQPDFIISHSRQLLNWRSYPRQTNQRSCRFSRDRSGYFYEYAPTVSVENL